jgi:DNA-binding SARP family transcriptional activator
MVRLKILGEWRLEECGETVNLGVRQQRLIAALAIHGRRSRHFYSGLLWPDCTEARALGSLRAAIFTVARRLPAVIECNGSEVQLADGIEVDLDHLREVLARPLGACEVLRDPWFTGLLSVELLPGWCEEWVLLEQQRLRHLYLAIAECRAHDLLQLGDLYGALAVAENIHMLEPLRESAVRIIIQAHLAMGNHSDAVVIFRQFWCKLAQELGTRPTDRLTQLVFPCRP